MQLDKDLATTLQVVTPEGRDFRMLTDSAHVAFYQRNNDEKYSADLVLARCQNGGTFIDVGAHHGYYSLLVATQRPQCQILAFEPVPDNCRILKENLRLNNAGNVQVFDSAASDRAETRDFHVRGFSSHGSLYGDHISQTVDTIKVTTVSLDRVLRGKPAPIVVKVDAEGHELHVLRGMADQLADSGDVSLLVEFNPIILRKAGQRPEELLQLVGSLGFDAYFVDDERRRTYRAARDRPAEWEMYFDEGDLQKGYANILCLKPARSLGVCLFSHSSQPGAAETELLELTAGLVGRGALCSVVLPGDGPLKTRLDEAGASTLVSGYGWWCDYGPVPGEEAAARFTAGITGLAGCVDLLSRINPHVVVTNTTAIPWGAIAATLLGTPHVWRIGDPAELGDALKFHLPLPKVVDIIRDSSNIVLADSDAVWARFFGETSAGEHFYTLPKGGLLAEQYGGRLLELLARVKPEPNRLSRACYDFSTRAVRRALALKSATIARLRSDAESQGGLLAESQRQLAASQRQLEAARHQLDAARREVASIKSSVSWRAARRIQRAYDLVLPARTKRRSAAERALAALLGRGS